MRRPDKYSHSPNIRQNSTILPNCGVCTEFYLFLFFYSFYFMYLKILSRPYTFILFGNLKNLYIDIFMTTKTAFDLSRADISRHKYCCMSRDIYFWPWYFICHFLNNTQWFSCTSCIFTSVIYVFLATRNIWL